MAEATRASVITLLPEQFASGYNDKIDAAVSAANDLYSQASDPDTEKTSKTHLRNYLAAHFFILINDREVQSGRVGEVSTTYGDQIMPGMGPLSSTRFGRAAIQLDYDGKLRGLVAGRTSQVAVTRGKGDY